jgi:hypothetical protein
MKLLAVTIKHYRIHKELSVAFHSERTVIGGPNEAGKSTIVEAVHNAFFLRSRVTGAVQKAMVSEMYPGQPTVDLRFESGGHEYMITKMFSGNQSASTTLKEHSPSSAAGRTWHGEEAEARIHEILRAEDVGGSRGVEKRIRMQWAHLWIWQGSSTDDPLAYANADRHGELLRERLARVEGGGVLESALDAAAARDIAARQAATFSDKGKPRGELDRAMKDREQAEADHAGAAAVVEKLDVAVQTIDAADATTAKCETELDKCQAELELVRDRQRQVAELGVRIAQQEAAATAAAAAHDDAVRSDTEIQSCKEEIVALEAKLEPSFQTLAGLEAEELECTARCDAAAVEMSTAGRRHAAAAVAFSLHDVREKQSRLLVEREGLGGRCARIAEQRGRARQLEAEMAELPAITDTDMADLGRLDRVREAADATLRAIATRVEVLVAGLPVTLGGADLVAGAPVTITAAAELVVGGPTAATTVRISPGGGRSLAEATQRLEEAAAAVEAALAARSVGSIEAAREAHARRQSLQADIHAVGLAIEGLGGDEAEADLAALDIEIEQVVAEIRRRAPGDTSPPANLAAAQAACAAAEREFVVAGEALAAASAAVATARERLASVTQNRQQTAERLRVNRTELEALRTKVAVLEERHGADRSDRITVLDEARREAAARMATSRTQLKRLAPDALDLDRQRLDRTLANLRAAKQDAETTRRIARARLELEGTADPREDLARAAVRRRLAEEELSRASREAEAIRLLAALFAAKKGEVESKFVTPLTSRVSGYLERLYGADTSVSVSYEEGRFGRLTLTRRGFGDTSFDFSQLSSGAKEQVAAAFRLAMAEVLAEDYGGCLPVVFDDAFVNSDADRQRSLQRLLDLAASRGLQVIVLACRPESYATLGADTVLLEANPFVSS